MKPEKISAILDKRMSQIGKLSDKIADAFDVDAIHDFRTSTKSLRAFMRVLAVANGDKFKLPGKFKGLYHIAGNIREAQLELEKIDAAKLYLPEYEEHLRVVISREKKEWCDKNTGKAVAKLKSRVEEISHANHGSVSMRHFVDAQLEGIHNLCMSPQITDDMVHSMRKLLKDAMYVVKGVQKELPGKFEDIEVERFGYCSQLLGDYNDARVMLGRLTAFEQVCGTAAEKQYIYGLLVENTPKLESERRRITDEMLSLTHQYATAGSRTGTELRELTPGQ